MQRHLYTYEYLDESFDDIVLLLADDHASVLQEATEAAVDHLGDLHGRLHVQLGRFDLARDIVITVGEFDPRGVRLAAMPLRWRAAASETLFPTMEATLEVVALSLRPPLTQLSLIGTYRPPLGAVGAVGDAVLGHRLADAAVHRFVREVADRIVREVRHRRSLQPSVHAVI